MSKAGFHVMFSLLQLLAHIDSTPQDESNDPSYTPAGHLHEFKSKSVPPKSTAPKLREFIHVFEWERRARWVVF